MLHLSLFSRRCKSFKFQYRMKMKLFTFVFFFLGYGERDVAKGSITINTGLWGIYMNLVIYTCAISS